MSPTDEQITVTTEVNNMDEVEPMAKKEKKGSDVPYWQTPKGKEAAKKYRNSEKGKKALARYAAKKKKAK